MAVSDEHDRQETNHSVDESELEQYGVWVKAGPEDVIEAEAEDEAFTLDDLSEDALAEAESEILGTDVAEDLELDTELPDDMTLDLSEGEEPQDETEEIPLDDLLDETSDSSMEMDLSELAVSGEDIDEHGIDLTLEDLGAAESDSEDALETLDLDLGEAEPASETEELEEESDLLTLEEDDLTIDLGEGTEELGLTDAAELESEPEAIPAEPVDGLDDLELEDLDVASEEPSPEPTQQAVSRGGGIVDDDLNIEEDLPDDLSDLKLDLDDLDVDSFDEPTAGASEEPEDLLAEDVLGDVEDLDLSTLPADDEGFEDISPEDLEQPDEGDLPELSLDEESEEPEELDLEEEAEPEELSLDAELSRAAAAAGDHEDLDTEILSLDEEIAVAAGLPDDDSADADEDLLDFDLDAGEDLLDLSEEPGAEIAPAAAQQQPAAQPSTSDRSLNLLENIERELLSIRTELGDLKRELGALKGPVAAAPSPPEESAEDEAAGGFFSESEDDDETIALTGAELDNIMNTAEFTEETGRPSEIDDVVGEAEPFSLDDLLPDIEDTSQTEPAVSEISLEEPTEEIEPLDIELDSADTESLLGSDTEVEALASLDIDAELADIEELEDVSEPEMTTVSESLQDIDLDDVSDSEIQDDTGTAAPIGTADAESFDMGEFTEEVVLDAEPLDDLGLDEEPDVEPAPRPMVTPEPPIPAAAGDAEASLPDNLKSELRSVLSYMDQLLESLPEDKIQEFAQSEHFTVYRRLFEELGLEQ